MYKIFFYNLTAYMLSKYKSIKIIIYFFSRFGNTFFILDIFKMSFFQIGLSDANEFGKKHVLLEDALKIY